MQMGSGWGKLRWWRLCIDHNLEEAGDGGGYVSRSRALRSQDAVTGRLGFRKNDRHKLRDQGLKIADTNDVLLLLATPRVDTWSSRKDDANLAKLLKLRILVVRRSRPMGKDLHCCSCLDYWRISSRSVDRMLFLCTKPSGSGLIATPATVPSNTPLNERHPSRVLPFTITA